MLLLLAMNSQCLTAVEYLEIIYSLNLRNNKLKYTSILQEIARGQLRASNVLEHLIMLMQIKQIIP